MRNIIGKQGFVSTRGETDKFDTIVETDTYFVSGNKLFLGNIDVEAALLSGSGGGGSGSANPGGVNTQLQYNNNGSFGGVPTLRYVSGTLQGTGSFSGSLTGTASYATTALTSSYAAFAASSSFATTASYAVSASVASTASLALEVKDYLNTVTILTYDFGLPASRTSFNDWSLLWEAYLQTSGAVEIHVASGFIVPTTPYTDYYFRTGTKLKSQTYSLYDPFITVTIPDTVVFWNLTEVEGIKLQSNSTQPCLRWTYNYPNVRLTAGAQLETLSTAPFIEWTEDSPANQLNILLEDHAKFITGTTEVLSLVGAGGGITAVANIRLGNSAEVQQNTIGGNTDSDIRPTALDGTAKFSFVQASYLGANSPLDPESYLGVECYSGINTPSINVKHPSSNGAPQLLFLGFTGQTTDATPTPIFPTQVPPPVISALAEIMIVARTASTGDSACWKFKALVVFDGGGASFGPAGFVNEFYDATPGAAAWSVLPVLNSPSTGQISINAIGEVGKTIEWNVGIIETIVLAF